MITGGGLCFKVVVDAVLTMVLETVRCSRSSDVSNSDGATDGESIDLSWR